MAVDKPSEVSPSKFTVRLVSRKASHTAFVEEGPVVKQRNFVVASALLTCAISYFSGIAVLSTFHSRLERNPVASGMQDAGDSSSENRNRDAHQQGSPLGGELLQSEIFDPHELPATDSPGIALLPSESAIHSLANDSSTSDSDSSLLIQEPLRRSAYRPDFSSSLRQSNYRSNFSMLMAFKEAVEENWQTTVQVFCDGEECSYGTIVDPDGWIITKASELDSDREIVCILCDQRQFVANVVSTLVDLDLALLQIATTGLPTIQWDYTIPAQGRWLATTDCRSGLPAAIGVVSAGPSRIPNQRAVLGVELAPDDANGMAGAKIRHVLGGSGAFVAGLQKEDVISSVNGASIQSRDQLLSLLRSGKGGQFLTLTVHREDEVIQSRVRLMDLSHELLDETEMEVNGPISARSTGFNRIFMHDTVLQPNQCGGPIVNLDGKVVGINIARAGRVATYALPADTVRPAVEGLLEQAKLVSHSPSAPSR